MALNKPAPSPQAVQAFRGALPAFLGGPTFGPVGAMANEVQLSRFPILPTYDAVVGLKKVPEHDWQELFVLGLHDLRAGKDLNAARAAGWRCFSGAIPGPVVTGHVAFRKGLWRLTAITFGTRASDSLSDSQALDGLPQIQNADYDLRFLRISGLNLEVFWLVSQSGGNDLIVPSPSGPAQLQSSLGKKRFFESPEFLSIVHALALNRLSYPATMGS